MMNWKCNLFGHIPGKERVNYGWVNTPSEEFWYIIQPCERCGQILKVLWPPKEEVLKRVAEGVCDES